ncbi:MAG: glycogen debranching protein GlgX [Anaerolineae bacterium]
MPLDQIVASAGKPLPYGASQTETGFNFAIFSRHATRVWLHLFTEPQANQPSHTFELEADTHRTGDIWHIHLAGVRHGQLYLYQMDGPYRPEEGHRFNRHKPLLDPYAKAIASGFVWDFRRSYGYDPTSPDEDLSFSTTTNFGGMPKCIAYGDDGFDWQGDRPLNRPYSETIIYETHVRSLTYHPSSTVEHPGTFWGVVEKIPYFKELGITAIELLPIHLFNEWEFTRRNPTTGEPLRNYWGYNTLAFFAPQNLYSHYPSTTGQQVIAFKEMVRELHKAGLEVILDVVFNHTVEGNHMGPTLSFRGIDNSIYYLLADDQRYYKDFTGVGNTLACNQPVVRDFIIDCLRYWVREMHVDGFRFDLATGLSRDRWGEISGNPALPARIAEDPLLRDAKIIAEPWDIGGYQVGSFPGGRWAEWNDKFRDDMRRYWRGSGSISALATRLAGSGDLYHDDGRSPGHSINFIAAHDGFTLNDLVSYNEKHNEANGEDNRDGHNHNESYNYGVEGPTADGGIEAIRRRQIKNFWATLMLSQGTPMINGGDEFRRTQQGNNNAYCQHNEISWYNWESLKEHAEIYRFARKVIALRKNHQVFRRTKFFTGLDVNDNEFEDVHWYNAAGEDATWDSDENWLMVTIDGSKEELGSDHDCVDVLMMFNASTEPRLFHLPKTPHKGHWRVVIDTGKPAPYDIFDDEHAVEINPKATAYRLQPRSMVVMFSDWLRHRGY